MVGRLLDRFCLGLRVLVGVLTMVLALPVAAQVIARYTGLIPVYLWTEELATFIFVWVVMIGSMIAVWDGTHFQVEVLPESRHPLLKLLQKALVLILLFLFGVLFVWYGIEYTQFGAIQNSVMLGANMAVTHVSVPIAGFIWSTFTGYRLYEAICEYRESRGSK